MSYVLQNEAPCEVQSEGRSEGRSYFTNVTHLQLSHKILRQMGAGLPPSFPQGFQFALEKNMSLADYRAIYNLVGRKWHWVERRKMNDEVLASIVHHPRTEIFVLRHNTRAIGFVELNRRDHPRAEIVLCGVSEQYIGRGFGRAMLRNALHYLATQNTKRALIQTCTLDHKSALPLYKSLGFRITHELKTIIYEDF